MATAPGRSALMEALEDALTKELKLVTKGQDPETHKPFTLTDKSKVWDRVLKLEAIKAKIVNPEFGTGFDDE